MWDKPHFHIPTKMKDGSLANLVKKRHQSFDSDVGAAIEVIFMLCSGLSTFLITCLFYVVSCLSVSIALLGW